MINKKSIHYQVNYGNYGYSEAMIFVKFIINNYKKEIEELNIETNYYIPESYGLNFNKEKDSPLDFLYEYKSILDDFIYSKNLSKIEKLIKFLENIEEKEEKLRIEDELNEIELKIEKLNYRKNELLKIKG